MTQLSIQVHGQMVRMGLQNLDAEIPKVGRLQIYNTVMAIRKGMQVKGTKPNYPIDWASIKQKKAFYASDGFGGGIPHNRTDDYVNSWQVEGLGNMGYRLVNKSQGAQFIGGNAYGLRQARMFRGHWPLFRDVADQEVQKLPENVNKEIKVVARRNGLMK